MRLEGLQKWPWKNTDPNSERRHNLILLLKRFSASQMPQVQDNVQVTLTLLRQMLHKHLRHKGFSCLQTRTQPVMQMHNSARRKLLLKSFNLFYNFLYTQVLFIAVIYVIPHAELKKTHNSTTVLNSSYKSLLNPHFTRP